MDVIEEERRRWFRELLDAAEPHAIHALHEVVATYRAQREDREGRHQDLTIEVHFNEH